MVQLSGSAAAVDDQQISDKVISIVARVSGWRSPTPHIPARWASWKDWD
jgi:hypothetical protein